MATLTGNSVGTSYLGLLKTTDNAVIGATEKNLTDGGGNASTLSVGTASASFTGNLDLTAATVTGIAGAGLVSGTGTDSMKSDDALTTVSSLAQGARSIAIGDGAIANSDGTIAIGSVANVPPAPRINYIAIGMDTQIAQNSIAIGKAANAQSNQAIAMGEGSTVFSDFGLALGYSTMLAGYQVGQIAIGNNAESDSAGNVAIGWDAQALGGGGFTRSNIAIGYSALASNERSIGIGYNVSSTGSRSVAISESANASGARSVAIGQASQSSGFNSVACGAYSQATAEGAFALGGFNARATALYAGALGRETTANVAGGVAIGYQVTTLWEYATTVNQLAVKNYAALNYADDAAAATAGVPLGGIFHTNGALKIRYAN